MLNWTANHPIRGGTYLLLLASGVALACCGDDENPSEGEGGAAGGLGGGDACGNGVVDTGEECDGSNLAGQDCAALGYAAGELLCSASCTIDAAACEDLCGDGVVGNSETCDDGNAAPGDGCGSDCTPEAGFDCTGAPSTCTTTCGDGTAAGDEVCDDANLRSHDGCSSGCTEEQLQWVNTGLNTPSDRRGGAMTYDVANGETWLFGGWDGQQVSSHLYAHSYDGSWTNEGSGPGSYPPPRAFAQLAYHEAAEVSVMFGGVETVPTALDDTWTHQRIMMSTGWSPISSPTSPTGRYLHRMEYDRAQQRIVLFGGMAGSTRYDDTWEFDGTHWIPVYPSQSPSARAAHGMAYDLVRGVTIIHGGDDGTNLLDDTWEFDGAQWQAVSTATAPPARREAAMTYDSWQQRTVLFGGYDGSVLGDLWEYDGTTWSELSVPNGPAARNHSDMVFDEIWGRIVLFGGATSADEFGDTWTLGYESSWPDELCENSIDEDQDGLVDCDDPDCLHKVCGDPGRCTAQGTCE
ncbi:MAG: hypothetical protein DRI90_13260 [Deltaproteobacteria bacterium]|nr:MAG: hypothetical protein DRI90_13260 [Deltaproteobacteria bacterium]